MERGRIGSIKMKRKRKETYNWFRGEENKMEVRKMGCKKGKGSKKKGRKKDRKILKKIGIMGRERKSENSARNDDKN